jgi:DNA-binding response OmpR family regulator
VHTVRVLVVSEDASERLRAVSALRLHADADVVEAHSAPEARGALQGDEDFDVLVVDGDLSPKGGFALLYSLQAQNDLVGASTPPSVVLAGREQDRWLGDWAGASAVLVKPVGPFVLAEHVRGLVGEVARPHGIGESGDQLRHLVDRSGVAGLTP